MKDRLLSAFIFALSLALLVNSPSSAQSRSNLPRDRVVCFLAEGFPTIDAPPLAPATLRGSLREYDVSYAADPESLTAMLNSQEFRELLLPYGSAFPVEAWPAIYNFISHGGSLVVLGGSPFHQPVFGEHGLWKLGTPQPTYAERLLIGPADPIMIDSIPFYGKDSRMTATAVSDFNPKLLSFPKTVYELTVRFCTKNDYTDEIGTAGPRDAVMIPLVHIVNGDGIPVACPLLEIDRLRGSEAGGRWILEPSDAALSSAAVQYCVHRALEGASQVTAAPVFACVDDGDVAEVRVNFLRPAPSRSDDSTSRVDVAVSNSEGAGVFKSTMEITGTEVFQSGEIEIKTKTPLHPGFYKVEIGIPGETRHPNSASTGFWIMDKKLLSPGPHLSVSRDWILKDGKVFPVVGTSYMGGDAGRKFLWEPNPLLWEKDFARMEKLGINFARVGLWTGWRKIMLDPGTMDEAFLRSLDALLLTAARHNIVICFNLFAFLPPANGGTNPYLDPRAVEWQQTFASLIASRYRDVGWINYDLINEPSYSPPDKIWKELPIRDEHEDAAWQMWIKLRHPGPGPEVLDDWRDGTGDLYPVPADDEFSYQQIRQGRRPRLGLDFELFTQDVLTEWAGDLRGVIRTSGGDHLVTLGQDEGGMALRSSQQFHYSSVDYTSMHTWWLNDNLLWDAVSSKVPEKPDLISETGLMRLESIDGEPWRSPRAAEELLERKFAYAFMGRGAGVVEWCWNINEFMTSDNEVGIGLTRADGTMKIETELLKQYSAFFAKAAPYLTDYSMDPVIVVIPDARLFSGFPDALSGVQAVVKTLSDRFGTVPTLISEFKLTEQRLQSAKLIIVPDAGMISDSAASQLLKASQHGATVLFTGAVEGNEYGKQSKQFQALGLNVNSVPVHHYEATRWGPADGKHQQFVTFSSGKSEYLRKAEGPTNESFKGNILNEPLPLELAEEKGPFVAMLRSVLNSSGIAYEYSENPVSSRVLTSANSALVVCVNESSKPLTKTITVDAHTFDIPVDAGRARLVLFGRPGGAIIAATEGEPIEKK